MKTAQSASARAAQDGAEQVGWRHGYTRLHVALEALLERRLAGRRRFFARVVALITGIGLCGEGAAMAVAPRHPGLGEALFFVAIVIPFTVYLMVLMAAGLGRLREVTVAILGLYPALIYRMSSPLELAGYDEHLHAQSLANLLLGSGLFSSNPGLPVSPYYPGLEILTAVAIRLTGLPPVAAASLVVLLCRLLLVLVLYQLAQSIGLSRRGASLVVAFYAVSSHFYAFDAGFAYETLALTLGLGGIYLLRRAQLADGPAARRLFLMALLVLVATAFTHHASSWMVLAFLIAWTAVARPGERRYLARATLVMGCAVVLWSAALASRLTAYFVPILAGAAQSTMAFLKGTGHRIFGESGGTPPPPDWERAVLVVYTIGTTVAALACAWVLLSRAYRTRDRELGLLGALNLAFPITAASHFDPSVGELGERAATFLFLPLALSCCLIIKHHPRVTGRPATSRPPVRPALRAGLIAGTAILYLGGVLIGSSPDWSRLPGPYLPSADVRTQDPETLAAVEWAARHIPPGSTVVADRDPAVLLESQARLWPITQPSEGFAPSQLYFSPVWGRQQTAIIKGLHIDYLYVDTRLANSLPMLGYYFAQGETAEPTRITKTDVGKFARVHGLKAVYQHGPVTIYDTAGLGVTRTVDGFDGYRTMGLGDADAILGAVLVLLFLAIRRRLAWLGRTARDSGVLGTALGVMALAIFACAALLEVRFMPGPAFTVGVLATSVAALAVKRRMGGLPIAASLPVFRRPDLLVLVGVVLSAAGVGIAVYAAWITGVVDVNAILRAVS